MQTFEEYLNEHNLEALTVSIKARVRYMTIYNAMKGLPITPEHAQQIHETVLNMSGVAFVGKFVLTRQVTFDELPTIPIKRIPKHNPT